MDVSINKRIKQLIENKLKITPYEFSKTIGNKRPDGLYRILKEEVNPSPKTLEKIFKIYPEYRYWILTGSGENLADSQCDELNEPLTKYKNTTLPGIKCTNPQCLEKIDNFQNEIAYLKEINKLLNEKIERLQSGEGAAPPEKSGLGSVEEPGDSEREAV